jgi:hypothetical protein
MKDLARFLAVLAIFVFGFSMQFVAMNQPFQNGDLTPKRNKKYFGDGKLTFIYLLTISHILQHLRIFMHRMYINMYMR